MSRCLFFLVITLSFVGCTKIQEAGTQSQVPQSGEEIFSNRPQLETHTIALIKLKSPALFSQVKIENGQRKIDPALKKQVEDEQTQLEAELKKLSPDIHILYRYKFVLNAMAVVTPVQYLEKFKGLGSVLVIERDGTFSRPKPFKIRASKDPSAKRFDKNPISFIGADLVHKLKVKDVAIDGTGVRVGIIDTGIDYTHAMFGGPGTPEAYKAIDPTKPSPLFPGQKVVGGLDLVGTDYDSGSPLFEKRVAKPDDNPLDEAGHGTHVAGTVAGVGDGVNTYSGVAPGASLYAIKVFGATGSTSDTVVIAALEYAANPKQNGDPADALDVVNLSLGDTYGEPHILYSEAVQNMVRGGTAVVAAAGNSGHVDYIVGAPAVADEAISVAASVDDSDQNISFRAVKFLTPTRGEVLTEAIEATFTKEIEDVGDLKGTLVAAGLADKDLPKELAAQIKGHVALIHRGNASFQDKIKRAAEAGAIGVVLVNNQPGEPFKMSGQEEIAIPAIMISQELGLTLQEEMKKGDVAIQFSVPEKIQKPELIDTLTDFSSKGPRSLDAAIKPEISAPGSNVISAAMGEGQNGVQMSGTSMATPHIVGVMALLRQARRDLTALELKSLLMGQAKALHDVNKNGYPVSLQGAGRVQALASVQAQLLSHPEALSLGEVNVQSRKIVATSFTVKNISQAPQDLSVTFETRSPSLISMAEVAPVSLAVSEEKRLRLRFQMDVQALKDPVVEIDGFVLLKSGEEVLLRVPLLAVVKHVSQIQATRLQVQANAADAAGAVVDLHLANNGGFLGDALLFNLLGMDQRKKDPTNSSYLSRACDLQLAGYRILDKNLNGQLTSVLQIVFKLYQPVTTWHRCEVSVLIDRDGDHIADQELAGILLESVPGATPQQSTAPFGSVLLDAAKAREIRATYEKNLHGKNPALAFENYGPAVLDRAPMYYVDHSTVAVVEADLTLLARSATGDLAIRLATIHDEASSVEGDDFLGDGLQSWMKISLDPRSQGYYELPEKASLAAGAEVDISLSKGFGSYPLLLLAPQNANVLSDVQKDNQAQVIRPKFGN